MVLEKLHVEWLSSIVLPFINYALTSDAGAGRSSLHLSKSEHWNYLRGGSTRQNIDRLPKPIEVGKEERVIYIGYRNVVRVEVGVMGKIACSGWQRGTYVHKYIVTTLPTDCLPRSATQQLCR